MVENRKDYAEHLRRRAEAMMDQTKKTKSEAEYQHDVTQLIHDLQVYQVELEIQNEDLRLTQDSLIESRNRFSNLFNQAPVGYLILDQKGVIVDGNKTFSQMTGWCLSALKGERFYTFIKEVDQKHFISRYQAFFNDPGDKVFEFNLKHQDGHFLAVRLQASSYDEDITRGNPAQNSDPKERYLLINLMDVTKQKESERELLIKSEAIESSVNAMLIANLRGIVQYVNSAFLSAWGYDGKAEVVNRHIDAIWKIEDSFTILPLLKKGAHWQGEILCQKKDGQLFDCYISAHLVADQNKRPMCIMISFLDISERKHIEHRLNETVNRFEALMQNIPNPVHLIDKEGRYLMVSQATADILGLSRTELQGKYFPEVLPPNIADDFMAGIEELQKVQKPFTKTDVVPTPEGERIYETLLFPVEKNGQTVEIIGGIVSDVTDRKKSEEKLKTYYEELEYQREQLEIYYNRLNEEVAKAKQIHDRILPVELPEVPGIAHSAFIQPAESMGGDFYDVKVKDNKLLIYLSDVSGHGLDGAMMSVFVKNTIEDYFLLMPESDLNPGQILRFIAEKYQREQYPDEYFIAIFIAVIDLNTWEMLYNGAGYHVTPYAVINGQKKELTIEGMPISTGFNLEFINFKDQAIQLEAESTILFTTDGLTEQEQSDKMYLKRLEKVFYANHKLPPSVLTHLINKDFWEFNGGNHQAKDDITYYIMQTTDEGLNHDDNNHALVHTWRVQSDLSAIESLLGEVSDILPAYLDRDALMVGLREIITNAMEHGNKLDPDKQVSLDIRITASFLLVVVSDEGKGFNWRQKMNRELDMEGHFERGRGISITEMTADHLFYNEAGNTAYLVKNF